jgi:hypothetical protein
MPTAKLPPIKLPRHLLMYPNHQGYQMVYFQTKNPNLGKFWRVLQWKMLVYFMAIWYIFRTFGIFYGTLVYFEVIWYIFTVLVQFLPFWYIFTVLVYFYRFGIFLPF